MTLSFLRKNVDTLAALMLFAVVLSIYLRTLCPTLYWGDCGELATVAATLGVPHPTGYPLYCLLGKFWTLILPVGSIVWRLNVLSAVFGALAVTCLFGFARAIALPRALALTAGGLLAFSFTFWQQSLITETYTLAACFTCLLLFLAARWKSRGCRSEDLRRLALAYGFTLTCHQTNTLFLPGFLLFLLWTAPHLHRLREPAVRREWAAALGTGALPLLLYLYLPLRARAHPAYNWGDVETPFAFFYHVTGRAYAGAMFHETRQEVLSRIFTAASNLRLEFSWPLVAVAALGLGLFWRRSEDRSLALLLTWILVVDVTFVINYSIYNGYIYFIPSYIILSVCAARGLLGLWQALEPRLETGKRPAFAVFSALCALALIPMQIFAHRQVDLSRNWTCYDYGRNLLASVPPHGVLIENGDDTATATVTYLQNVEGRRPDVALVRRSLLGAIYDPNYGQWANAWYVEMLRQSYPEIHTLYPDHSLSPYQAVTQDPMRRLIRDALAKGTPVCALCPAGGPQWFSATPEFTDDDGKLVSFDFYLRHHYEMAQIGLVTRIYPRGQRPADAVLQAETERVWRSYSLRGVFDGNLAADQYLGLLALNYGTGDLARAKLAYQRADYTTAEEAYGNVLTLFTCAEAEQGLQQCRQSRRQPTRKMAFLPVP